MSEWAPQALSAAVLVQASIDRHGDELESRGRKGLDEDLGRESRVRGRGLEQHNTAQRKHLSQFQVSLKTNKQASIHWTQFKVST